MGQQGEETSAVDVRAWSDSSARAVLQLMVESVTQMIGFEMATLSVVLGDSFVTVGYAGPEEFREFLMQDDPVSVLDPILANPHLETWGRFCFLAAEHYDGGQTDLDGHWLVVSGPQADGPDAWHPDDVLLAALHDGDRLIGMVSVDKPSDGRRPDARQRELLERYAAQAERAVITAFEREELVQQVAHAEAARQLVRSASMPAHTSLEAVLSHTHEPLVEGFRAAGSWIQVLEPQGTGLARARDGSEVELTDDVVALAHDLAPRMWAEQRVLVIGAGSDAEAGADGAASPALDEARRQLAELGLTSALAVPLGAGPECLGFLALTRGPDDPAWSAVETASALEIGHDLGAALVAARALERERRLVRELQQLDDYRSQLIATLSHELRTPLTVISGNLELLGGLELDPAAARFQEAMARGASRMQKVVDDLLLLARVSDPQHPLEPKQVDLYQLTSEAVALVDSTAGAKELTVHVELEPGPLVVLGEAAELDRLVGNLVSNAVKYTPAGGNVAVRVYRRDTEVVFQVADDGLGISEEDQVGLFRPFFRSTNPDALREPGTGLGLAIVATVAERHGGRVEVSSRLGSGTTFTVTLPAA